MIFSNTYVISAFLFNTLLFIAYFSKRRLRSVENKIYDVMVISSFLGTIISIFTYLIVADYYSLPTYILIIPKVYLIYLIAWGTAFSLYVIHISLKEKNKNKWKYIRNIFIVISLIASILVLVLPMEYVSNGKEIYTAGISVYLTYILAFIYFIITFIFIVLNLKNVIDKRYTPVLSFIIILGIVATIQFKNPELLMVTFAITFNTMLMYFTIENPDVLLLKEYEKAKSNNTELIEKKEMFILNVSQDLKKPLVVINNISSRNKNTEDVLTLQNGYNQVEEISGELLNTIDENLNISSVEKTKLKIEKYNYNPNMTFIRLSKIFENKIDNSNKKIVFKKEIIKKLPKNLYGDETKLRQIIRIALENSLKYTSTNGQIELSVNNEIKDDICRLIITIQDNGVGIKKSKIEEILDKDNIYKFGEMDEEKENLSLCKILLLAMGGNIIIDSSVGKGTTVKIILDQKISNKEDKNLSSINLNADKYTKIIKVAILVRNNMLLEKIKRCLKSDRFELDASNCIKKIRKNYKYDCIIIDENLDLIDGISTYKNISKIRNFNIPTLLLKNNTKCNSNNEYLEYGFSELVDYNEIDKLLNKKIYDLVEKDDIM